MLLVASAGSVAGDKPGLPFAGAFSVATWNCRALFGVDTVKAKIKQQKIFDLAQMHDVVEVHTDKYLIKHFNDRLAISHTIWWSHGKAPLPVVHALL